MTSGECVRISSSTLLLWVIGHDMSSHGHNLRVMDVPRLHKLNIVMS